MATMTSEHFKPRTGWKSSRIERRSATVGGTVEQRQLLVRYRARKPKLQEQYFFSSQPAVSWSRYWLHQRNPRRHTQSKRAVIVLVIFFVENTAEDTFYHVCLCKNEDHANKAIQLVSCGVHRFSLLFLNLLYTSGLQSSFHVTKLNSTVELHVIY